MTYNVLMGTLNPTHSLTRAKSVVRWKKSCSGDGRTPGH